MVCADCIFTVIALYSFFRQVDISVRAESSVSGEAAWLLSAHCKAGWIESELINNVGGGIDSWHPQGWLGGVCEVAKDSDGFFYAARFPFWEPVLILSLWPVWHVVNLVRSRNRASHFLLCSQCGYNLTGNTSGTCPECSQPIEPPALSP